MLRVLTNDKSPYGFPKGGMVPWTQARDLFPSGYRITIIGCSPNGSDVVIIADDQDQWSSIPAAVQLLAEFAKRGMANVK